MISPIQRMTSAFSSAGDRSSRFPGGDMPLQNLKSLYAESPDLPIFTRAVSPCPLQLRQQNLRARTFAPITSMQQGGVEQDYGIRLDMDKIALLDNIEDSNLDKILQ